jgi:hypothetical protein
VVVVDISDQVFSVVVEFEGFSKEVDCVWQVLLQDAEIEIGVPRVFAVVPEGVVATSNRKPPLRILI